VHLLFGNRLWGTKEGVGLWERVIVRLYDNFRREKAYFNPPRGGGERGRYVWEVLEGGGKTEWLSVE